MTNSGTQVFIARHLLLVIGLKINSIERYKSNFICTTIKMFLLLKGHNPVILLLEPQRPIHASAIEFGKVYIFSVELRPLAVVKYHAGGVTHAQGPSEKYFLFRVDSNE